MSGAWSAGAPAVEVRGLRRAYAGREVLRGVDLTVDAGEIVALVGRSGCGKSTLLRAIGGLERADAGSVRVPRTIGIGFQDPSLLPWRRVWRNVALGGGSRADAAEILRAVGIAERADAWPLTLSGGEAQRVALARALVRGPALLLLDEPFSALDALTRREMHALLRDLHARLRPAVVLVTHDVDEARALADRIAVLDEGRILVEEPADAPRERLLAHLGA